MTVLANQINMDLHKIRQKCPLYETHGKSVGTVSCFETYEINDFSAQASISLVVKNDAVVIKG